MPDLFLIVKDFARRIIRYGKDLTPPEVHQQDAERLQEIAAQMKRAGINTRAVRRAVEMKLGARD